MAKVEIWVPILGPGDPKRPDQEADYEPDLPEGVEFGTDEGAPTDFGDARARPATKHFNVIVDERDAPKCAKRVPDGDVPEEDKLLVGMLRHCRRNIEAEADGFFDAILDVANGTDARKRMVKRLLIHAVHRGLSPARAERIRRRLNLPEATARGQ